MLQVGGVAMSLQNTMLRHSAIRARVLPLEKTGEKENAKKAVSDKAANGQKYNKNGVTLTRNTSWPGNGAILR